MDAKTGDVEKRNANNSRNQMSNLLSDSIKKNGIKVDGKQNYQCKDCKRQFIGDHALSYRGCNSALLVNINS